MLRAWHLQSEAVVPRLAGWVKSEVMTCADCLAQPQYQADLEDVDLRQNRPLGQCSAIKSEMLLLRKTAAGGFIIG